MLYLYEIIFFNYIYSVNIIFKSRGFVKDCKNEDRLKALDSKIDQKVEDVKSKVGAVMDIVDQIKKLLDKINKK